MTSAASEDRKISSLIHFFQEKQKQHVSAVIDQAPARLPPQLRPPSTGGPSIKARQASLGIRPISVPPASCLRAVSSPCQSDSPSSFEDQVLEAADQVAPTPASSTPQSPTMGAGQSADIDIVRCVDPTVADAIQEEVETDAESRDAAESRQDEAGLSQVLDALPASLPPSVAELISEPVTEPVTAATDQTTSEPRAPLAPAGTPAKVRRAGFMAPTASSAAKRVDPSTIVKQTPGRPGRSASNNSVSSSKSSTSIVASGSNPRLRSATVNGQSKPNTPNVRSSSRASAVSPDQAFFKSPASPRMKRDASGDCKQKSANSTRPGPNSTAPAKPETIRTPKAASALGRTAPKRSSSVRRASAASPSPSVPMRRSSASPIPPSVPGRVGSIAIAEVELPSKPSVLVPASPSSGREPSAPKASSTTSSDSQQTCRPLHESNLVGNAADGARSSPEISEPKVVSSPASQLSFEERPSRVSTV